MSVAGRFGAGGLGVPARSGVATPQARPAPALASLGPADLGAARFASGRVDGAFGGVGDGQDGAAEVTAGVEGVMGE